MHEHRPLLRPRTFLLSTLGLSRPAFRFSPLAAPFFSLRSAGATCFPPGLGLPFPPAPMFLSFHNCLVFFVSSRLSSRSGYEDGVRSPLEGVLYQAFPFSFWSPCSPVVSTVFKFKNGYPLGPCRSTGRYCFFFFFYSDSFRE